VHGCGRKDLDSFTVLSIADARTRREANFQGQGGKEQVSWN
jgi:hypothetical protein